MNGSRNKWELFTRQEGEHMEQIAKGIWKVVFGEPEKYTPEYFRSFPIKKEMIDKITISRKPKIKEEDLEWKKTFIVKSIQAKRDVIPVRFGGRNSDFFYNLANICKALGIKFNIAMLYLADEMFKNRHKTFTVTFGKPIPWQTFDKSKTPAQWAEYVKDIVYKL